MNACAVLDFCEAKAFACVELITEVDLSAATRPVTFDGMQTTSRQRAGLTKHLQELGMKSEEFEALRARQEALYARVNKLVNAYTRDDLEDEEGRLLLALLTARRLSEDLLVGLMEEAAELETLRLVLRAKTRGEPPKVR